MGGEAQPAVRARILAVDEDGASLADACVFLHRAGYEVVGVTRANVSPVLLREAPKLVLFDVSAAATLDDALAGVRHLNGVTDSRYPIFLTGVQSRSELSTLARACWAAGWFKRPLLEDEVLPILEMLVPTRRDTAVVPSASAKVLLIDDSEVVLELIQERLKDAGIDVRIAVALGEVRSIVQGWSPNVVVADVNMPDIRGDDLCARLKATTGRDVLVMLCSGMPEEELREVARRAGADGFLPKGIGIDALVDRITSMCARRSEPQIAFHESRVHFNG
jgi:DNA-binding response OmpR family regulator